jgi:hypothetical protein
MLAAIDLTPGKRRFVVRVDCIEGLRPASW